MKKFHLPLLTGTEFAVVLAALRKFAENPIYMEHFNELGHTQRKQATSPNWIDGLADRINTNTEST